MQIWKSSAESNNKIAENFAQVINANIGGGTITASSAGAV